MGPRLLAVLGTGAKATGRSRRHGKRREIGLERLEGRELLSRAPFSGGEAIPPVEIARFSRVRQAIANDTTTPTVVGQTVLQDIVYNKDGEKLDVYLPVGQAPAGGWPAIVAFPGGGWRWASKKDYGGRASVLTHYGFAVIAADYTYSSGAPGSRAWPADFNDVRAAVQWVRNHADRFKIDPNKIAAMGESSGAYMANMLGVYPNGPVVADSLPAGATAQTPPSPGQTSASVSAVVDFYGPTNIPTLYQDAPKTRDYVTTFIGGTPDQLPGRAASASPVNYVAPGDPPFFIVHGTADTAVPDTQSIQLAAELQAAGVPHRVIYLDGYKHGFSFQNSPPFVLQGVVAFLNQAFDHQAITT